MDIFNLNTEDFITQSKANAVKNTDDNIFDPDVSQGQNGVYKAVLRFIPFHGATSAKEMKYQRYSVKVTNPLTKERFYADDPSTIGLSSIFWTLDTKLKALKMEEPELESNIRKSFSRNYKYYALALIKKDPQNPSNEGKIKVVPFGYQINQMFDQQVNPQDAELGISEKCNPFDLLNGKDFVYVAKKKTEFWRDFSACKFMDVKSPLIIKNSAGKELAFSSDTKVQAKFKEYLVANSPDLSQYFFKEWTPETYTKAAEALRAAFPSTILETAFELCRDTAMVEAYQASKKGSGTQVNNASRISEPSQDEDLLFTSKKSKAAPVAETVETDDFFDEIVTPTQTAKTKSKAAPVEEEDDMFADL